MCASRGLQRYVCLQQGESQSVASRQTLQSRSVSMLYTPSQQLSFFEEICISQILIASPASAKIVHRMLNILIISTISQVLIINCLFVKEQYLKMEEVPPHKKSFCRFYLRGLCIKNSHECPFSHGVWDLDYDYWKEDEVVEYDYHKTRDQYQHNTVKQPPVYKNLYEFQVEKLYSLEDLSQSREDRNLVRYEFHKRLYYDFMQLLEIKHPEMPFTQSFLLREFTRVGFNKIFMKAMNFNQILAFVCDVPGSPYFKTTKIVPPNPNKQTVVLRKASEEEIVAAYREEYQKIMKKVDKQLQENSIKKQLFIAKFADNIPPLNQVLKDRKMTFIDFVSKVLKEDTSQIIMEASMETIQQQALTYLQEKLPDGVVNWNDMYNHLCKTMKTNNGRILNEVKPYLVFQHNLFLFFPTIQYIYNPKLNSHIFNQLRFQPCKCPFQHPYKEQDLLFDQKDVKELIPDESYDINSFESLVKCAPHILASDVLGVDLQGNLRKGGFVEMIQLNNGKNTFLIDIWDLNQKGDFQTFWLARKILRNVMVNPKIVKIFHDCRHDSIGLHEMIQTCIVNVFDTSACETLINQLDLYRKLGEKQKEHKQTLNDCKNVIGQCTNVKTPGLNEILKKYEARHGINKNKDKYHKMWSKGEISFFCKRPLDPDYRQYCIKDVLDLPEIHKKMLGTLPEQAVEMAYWVSTLYAQSAYDPK